MGGGGGKITFQITDTKFCVTFLKEFSERALFKIAETNLNTWRRKVISMDHYSKFVICDSTNLIFSDRTLTSTDP